MNWRGAGESIDAFLADWERATLDRSYVPRSGDSSHDAAARFLAALDELRVAVPDGTAVVVTHGGLTVDLLRTLLGDVELRARAPQLIAGVPCGAVTTVVHADGWAPVSLPDATHLA